MLWGGRSDGLRCHTKHWDGLRQLRLFLWGWRRCGGRRLGSSLFALNNGRSQWLSSTLSRQAVELGYRHCLCQTRPLLLVHLHPNFLENFF